jgi:hypothetical protein
MENEGSERRRDDDDATLRKIERRHPSQAEGSEETVDEALENEENKDEGDDR